MFICKVLGLVIRVSDRVRFFVRLLGLLAYADIGFESTHNLLKLVDDNLSFSENCSRREYFLNIFDEPGFVELEEKCFEVFGNHAVRSEVRFQLHVLNFHLIHVVPRF